MTDEEYGLNMETIADLFDLDTVIVQQLHEKGVNCPQCGDYLQNLGEIIAHKHDFSMDELRNVSDKSGGAE